jgi:hypothetical protein
MDWEIITKIAGTVLGGVLYLGMALIGITPVVILVACAVRAMARATIEKVLDWVICVIAAWIRRRIARLFSRLEKLDIEHADHVFWFTSRASCVLPKDVKDVVFGKNDAVNARYRTKRNSLEARIYRSKTFLTKLFELERKG